MNEQNGINRFFQRVVHASQRFSLGQAGFLFLGLLGFGVACCTVLLSRKFSKEHAVVALISFSLFALCSFFGLFAIGFAIALGGIMPNMQKSMMLLFEEVYCALWN